MKEVEADETLSQRDSFSYKYSIITSFRVIVFLQLHIVEICIIENFLVQGQLWTNEQYPDSPVPIWKLRI